MADKEAARLAKSIIRESFGELVGNVASVLIDRGRLHLPELCHYTRLRSRTVQSVLIVLLQHNLLWRSELPFMGSLVEFFEVDLKECLLRCRWARMLAMTEDEFGEDGVRIVTEVMVRGKARVGDIVEALSAAGGGGSSARKGHIMDLFYKLLITEHVLPTDPALSMAPFDEISAKRKVAEKAAGTLATAKEIEATRQRVIDDIRSARAELAFPERGLLKGSTSAAGQAAKTGQKRKSTANGSAASSSKKAKNGGDALAGMGAQIDPKAMFRVNYDRYNVRLRNELFVRAASDRWNPAAGGVVHAFLTRSIASQKHVKQRSSEPVTLTHALAGMSPTDKDRLSFGLGATKLGANKRLGELAAAFAELMAGEDDMGAGQSDGVFLIKDTVGARATGGSYRVAFERVCERLKRQLLEAFVEERWGSEAKRLIRVLGSGQKLGESSLQTKALMKLDRVRTVCGTLHEHNIIELQQVPKGNDRIAIRSTFLWFLDLSHTYITLLSAMYKALANLAERRQAEMANREALIERANRTDVLSGEGRLSERDQRELEELDDILDKITTAELRTELNVFILRDLPGGRQTVRWDDPFAV